MKTQREHYREIKLFPCRFSFFIFPRKEEEQHKAKISYSDCEKQTNGNWGKARKKSEHFHIASFRAVSHVDSIFSYSFSSDFRDL